MMRICFLICLFWALSSGISCAEIENPLVVSCEIRAGEYCSGMPIPLDVIVSNTSDQVVYVFEQDYRPVSVDVKRKGVKFDPQRPPGIRASHSRGVPLMPKSCRKYVYILNKYVSMELLGNATIEYNINVNSYIITNDEYECYDFINTASGELVIKLLGFDKSRLREVLDKEIGRLPSNDPLVVLEVAESICYLDNPIVLDYLEKIIETRQASAQFMALDGLKRFNNERSKKLVLELLDPEGHQNVVSVVFEFLVSENVKLEGADVKKMLESNDSNIRYNTLTYIKEVGILDYLDLIKPLIEDEDEEVSRLAADMLSSKGSPIRGSGQTQNTLP